MDLDPTPPATALKGVESSAKAHHFLGVSAEGVCGIVQSSGNSDTVAVLSAPAGKGTAGLAEAVARVHAVKPTVHR